MADPHSTRIPQNPVEYYGSFTDSPNLLNKFNDIDDEVHFQAYLRLLQKYDTKNFVLDFGNDDAWCAINLVEDDFTHLLKYRPGFFGTRWINIWSPEEQKDTIKAIMSHYGVSERLQGMMCTEPVSRSSKPAAPATPRIYSRSRSLDRSLHTEVDDIEGAYATKDLAEDIDTSGALRNLSFAEVANQIWHFCSVDHGPRYTCIGYNCLYVIPGVDNPNGKALPDGLRIWSWLVLFEDGTVVSIQENPFPTPQDPLPESEVKPVLEIVRRNVRFIFAGVSKQHAGSSSDKDTLVTIRVRHFNDSGPDQAGIKQEDGPSLLFYYIFDDWVSSYGLIAKREHQYGVRLDHLRENMLERPVVDLVNELHWLGRRLAVLKRLYQSYELIMTRILQRQRLLRDEARSQARPTSMGNIFTEPEFSELRQPTLHSQIGLVNINDSVGVQLSSAAVARFERLLDRIKLYCLSEIDACLTEKESLTFLNFNLIALKDTQAVEKLTRITILLAKVTILFLPVSLMTEYFGTELKGVKGGYTTVQYWAAFGVIMFLSMLLLTAFGFASDTVEGKPIYRSLVRSFYRTSRHRFTQRKGANS